MWAFAWWSSIGLSKERPKIFLKRIQWNTATSKKCGHLTFLLAIDFDTFLTSTLYVRTIWKHNAEIKTLILFYHIFSAKAIDFAINLLKCESISPMLKIKLDLPSSSFLHRSIYIQLFSLFLWFHQSLHVAVASLKYKKRYRHGN